MTNLDSILETTMVHIVITMVFLVVLYGLWRRLSTEELMLSNCGAGEDSWECHELQREQPVNPKGNQPWIFIGRTDAEVQYFGHLMWRVNSCEKSLMLGKTEGKTKRRQQRMRWLDGITDTMGMNLIKLWERVELPWHAAVQGLQSDTT